MNTAASIGPVQFVILAYLICIVVSLGVAWVIRMLFSGIKLQRNVFSTKAVAVKVIGKKDLSQQKER
ncbi:MAG: hypothetical protein A2031_06080 [Deltaproteobacteria bacterium RBG_19FT_COMBO_43_11]|nr:MAG: hypothetical protein A2031_06080 [Deltaproteobacteria bacterium RBG_19FT_COMBO_43_11]